MDFLSKHFFDYQSFVNIPQRAVQLHKNPHSEAGIDTTAQWTPKNMRIQGKNLATPASRPSRNRIEASIGSSHRHGRPSKLEFRKFGERHGELKEEKIVPHKDKWMLDGGFRHFGEESEDERNQLLTDLFPHFFKNKIELDIKILTILTLGVKSISLTIKEITGLEWFGNVFIRIQVFDGSRLIDERRCPVPRFRYAHQYLSTDGIFQNGPMGHRFITTAPSSPQLNHINRIHRRSSSNRYLFESVGCEGESFLLCLTPKQINTTFIIIQLFEHTQRRQLTTPVDGISQLNADNRRNTTNLIGCCVIGAIGYPTRGFYQWKSAIQQRHPVYMWHRLLGSKGL